jgi:hypothetical protein
MKHILLILPLLFLSIFSFSQDIEVDLVTELPGQSPEFGLRGEYLDVEQLCVTVRLNTIQGDKFETDLYYRIERILDANNRYEFSGGFLVDKNLQASSAMRRECLSDPGSYRLTIYQQYANAAQVNDYTEFPKHVEDFTINIKGKAQDKILTTSTGGNYFETAYLTLHEIKDGSPKSDLEWTFKIKEGKAEVNFLVKMNEPLRLSVLKAVISSYDSKVSAKNGVTVEDEKEYKTINYAIPSRDWNSVTATFTIEDPDDYFLTLYSQDDQYIERISFKVK